VGVRVGRFEDDGLLVGRAVVGRGLGWWVGEVNNFVSDPKNTPPECIVCPFTRISYLPIPDPQQIPSPNESVIVNLYAKQLGRQILVECTVKGAVYFGLLTISPLHLLLTVHTVSFGKLSVVTLTSTSVPAEQGVGEGVGLHVGSDEVVG
jgi:hypothetical protein